MLHLTPATLQGHTVGEEIKGLFLTIPFDFFSFFFFLMGKKGRVGLMEARNWWSWLPATFGCLCFQASRENLNLPVIKPLITELENLETILKPAEG